MPRINTGSPLGCVIFDVPIRLQLDHSTVPSSVHRGSSRWRMPSDTISGRSTVKLAEPVVLPGSTALVNTTPSTFWLRLERQPIPIVVVGVGVSVTPAVAPTPYPVPRSVPCTPGGISPPGPIPFSRVALAYSICTPAPTLIQSLIRQAMLGVALYVLKSVLP